MSGNSLVRKLLVAGILAHSCSAADDAYRRGLQELESGNTSQAIKAFQEAVKKDERNAQAWKALGVLHALGGDYVLAEHPFERACSLAPRLPDACYFYGRVLYALNRFELSMAAVRKGLSSDPKPWRIHQSIGQAQEALGQHSEAEESFITAIKLNSKASEGSRAKPDDHPQLHYAVFLFRQGRLDHAFAQTSALVASYPDSARAHFELGRVLYQRGDVSEAAAHLEKALPHGGAAHLLLAKAYLRLGKKNKAEEHMKLGAQTATAP